MKEFLIRLRPEELLWVDPVREAAEVKGVYMRAFCAEGAELKARRLGLISNLKSFVVERDGVVVGLYPMRYPLAMVLDAPLDLLLGWLRG